MINYNYLIFFIIPISLQGGILMIKEKRSKSKPITVRKTAEMDKMISYLENKWLLNPTAVMRHALALAYEWEIKKEQGD